MQGIKCLRSPEQGLNRISMLEIQMQGKRLRSPGQGLSRISMLEMQVQGKRLRSLEFHFRVLALGDLRIHRLKEYRTNRIRTPEYSTHWVVRTLGMQDINYLRTQTMYGADLYKRAEVSPVFWDVCWIAYRSLSYFFFFPFYLDSYHL